MGAQILIRLESDKYDDNNLSPFLGRDFHWEITRGHLWKDTNQYFLNKRESNLLEAPYDETLEDGFGEPINPKSLLIVIKKVDEFLKNNKETLPFDITIDYDKMKLEGLDYPLMVNNSKCWIQGDSYLFEVYDEVKIVNHPHEPNEVDLWVKLNDEITLENKVYYLKKITRNERFKEDINAIINFCNHAIEKNEKIYWIYSQ